MEEATRQVDAAVFAADGPLRHRLVRTLAGAGVALLATWLVALTLGVFGGFESLPGLPSLHSRESHQADSQPAVPTRGPRSDSRRARETPVKAEPATPPSTPSNRSRVPSGQSSPRAPSTTKVAPQASTAPSPQPVATSRGRALGTTKTTNGKPVGSPGNGPGGSGPPGQLR